MALGKGMAIWRKKWDQGYVLSEDGRVLKTFYTSGTMFGANWSDILDPDSKGWGIWIGSSEVQEAPPYVYADSGATVLDTTTLSLEP